MGTGTSKQGSTNNNRQSNESEEFIEDSSQRIVLITGCSTGIGLALAVCLANDENKRFKVYATMRNLSKKNELEEAAKDVLGDLLMIKRLDVCEEESVKAVVQEILETEQRIDILVNNAGVAVFSPAESVDTEKIKTIFNTNTFGLMSLTNQVIPGMKSRESGHIVHISSVYGVIGVPFGEYYSSSKFAVEGYAESLAPVLQKFSIKTTMIEPGPVATQFTGNAKQIREQVDISSVDDKTKVMMKEALTSYYEAIVKVPQKPTEIAELVKKVLLLKNPHFRYQSHPVYRQKEMTTKFNDMCGDGIMGLFGEKFGPHL